VSKKEEATEKEALLVNQEVQSVVQRMVDQGVYLITPRLDTKGLSYPALTNVFPEKSEAEIQEFLEKLRGTGILKSKLLDKVIVCPTCGSPSVYSKYNCPRCSSFDIGKASIIEHVRCGYIGSKEKFQKGNLLICPKCKNTVGEVDYRKIGTSFECNSCGSRFEAPRMSHKCNSCDDVFTYKEARYEPIFEFELSEETKRSVAKGTLPLASILNTLKDDGFEVGLKSDLIGKSGATHNFDIVARKSSALVVANFTFEPKEEDIIGLFAKKYDVDPTFTLLIALTPPSKEEETVSKAYGVMIISSTGNRSIGEQIIDLVNDFFEKAKPEAGATVAPQIPKPLSAVELEDEKPVIPTPMVSITPPSPETKQDFWLRKQEEPSKDAPSPSIATTIDVAPEDEKEDQEKEEELLKLKELMKQKPEETKQEKRKTLEFDLDDEEWEQYNF
jgi:Thaumarchaeal output domain 1